MKYEAKDFQKVMGVPGKYYCPGCNASWDDVPIVPINCPCITHGNKKGALNHRQLGDYLDDTWGARSA